MLGFGKGLVGAAHEARNIAGSKTAISGVRAPTNSCSAVATLKSNGVRQVRSRVLGVRRDTQLPTIVAVPPSLGPMNWRTSPIGFAIALVLLPA